MEDADRPLVRGGRELKVVGDRVLVEPLEAENRTAVGLLLPPGAAEKEAVQTGRILAIGPGTPLPPPSEADPEPWKDRVDGRPRYLPMTFRLQDVVVFFRKAAVEVRFDDQDFLVVPHGAILVIEREASVPDALPEDL